MMTDMNIDQVTKEENRRTMRAKKAIIATASIVFVACIVAIPIYLTNKPVQEDGRNESNKIPFGSGTGNDMNSPSSPPTISPSTTRSESPSRLPTASPSDTPTEKILPFDTDALNFGHFEGDIIVSYDDVLSTFGKTAADNAKSAGVLSFERDQAVSLRGGVGSNIRLWPDKTVHYYWAWTGDDEEDARDALDEAMVLIRTKVGIQFIELSSNELADARNYISIVRDRGCYSSVGMQQGPQRLSLGDGCLDTGTATHELLHALGMWHEQSMYNRDDFVEIIWENIPNANAHNFHKQLETTYLGLNYDYESIMHYTSNAFGINEKQTIKAIGNHFGSSNSENEGKMAQRDELTDTDAVQLQLMYHCPSGPRNVMDLCSPECPCSEGQGNCESDDDCSGNLTCKKPSSPFYRHRTHRIEIPNPDFKVCTLGTCDCNYAPGGCAISKEAPPNWSCRCEYEGAWTCRGYVDYCDDDDNEKCVSPDKSIQSCAQGKGDCHGYTEAEGDCDCDYANGGCAISTPAPQGLGCKCLYLGFWTCSGAVQLCLDPDDEKCKNPDKSIQSCAQGGGDCGGYSEAEGDCDCDYHSHGLFSGGGCKISKTPPNNLACECQYRGAWTCGGQVVRCKNPSSTYCRNPDTSYLTCLQGNGDCEGY